MRVGGARCLSSCFSNRERLDPDTSTKTNADEQESTAFLRERILKRERERDREKHSKVQKKIKSTDRAEKRRQEDEKEWTEGENREEGALQNYSS